MPSLRPTRLPPWVAAVFVAASTVVLATCHEDQGLRSPTEAAWTPSFQFSPGSVSLVGAGNIARCDRTNDEATATLLDGISGTVFALGDAAYPNGTTANYQNCYNASWGRHKSRTVPVLGNHDYDSSATAAAYFGYFGAAAGDPTKGYYSFDIGSSWHIIVLNSNSTKVATALGSPQEMWLRADLAANTKPCVVAMWHHPRFYSTTSTSLSVTTSVKPFWDDLIAAHATLILNGHMRDYERFAPQNSAGVADPENGIRQIIVGTGGEGLDATNTLIAPNSEVRISGVYGVLALTLGAGSYSWQFVPVAGQTASDGGTGACWGQGPMTPTVDAGPDKSVNPGDTVSVTIGLTDPGSNDAPWNYVITWGDGTSTTGTKPTATPIVESHVYSTLPDSARVTVTNAFGMSGSDSLAVTQAPTDVAVLVGAGDIGDSATQGDSLTANLLDGIQGTVFTLGDNAYQNGSSSDFANYYQPTWGRHKSRTKPVVGNHEYMTSGASGYFGYFGAAAGDPTKGYYSYDLGGWHIIALNGELDITPSSQEVQWLRNDLALHSGRCTLAYWHAPRFVSGVAITSNPKYQTLWDTLYKYGADVVMNGHKHSYERLAPQTPAQVLDTLYGIRSFIVGTGGTGWDGGDPPAVPNSEVRNTRTWGVLKLTLHPDSYSWQFIPVAGSTFMDAGSGLCHDAPSVVNHAPVAVVNAPSTGTEGTAVAFDGSGSSDPDGDALSYAWSFGDGTSGTGVAPSHTYADNGSYTVTLTVTDARGLASQPATAAITVGNATPVVTAAAQTASVGASFSFTTVFSDAGTNDGPWSYTIDWGDSSATTTGSATSQTSPISAAHTYAAAGTSTVLITVTDKDGGAGSATATITVTAANNAPTANPGGPYTGVEGGAVSLNGAGSSDPDGDALTYAWTFGDGTTGTGVAPSHVYADNGTFTVTLVVTDARGAASAPAATTATIANVAPSVNASANQTVTAGTPLTLNATFSDPGVNDATWSYSIDWGDGSAPTTGTKPTTLAAIQASHTYISAGAAVATVTVTDKDGGAGTGTASITITPPVVAVTLVGAGNIARCDRSYDEATAAILDTIPGTVFALGDNAYPNGTPTNYANCYAPSWGRHKARTYAAAGNHDYDSSSTAAGYFGYFGAAGGDPGKAYYSFDLGAWHIVVLNSNTSFVSAAAGSPQETWLKADLAATTKQCVLAMWHNPRFYSTTSTSFSPTSSVKPLWDDLYAAHAELIINAHMRDYERFAPQTPTGVADPVNGIREIIVGTGGEGLDNPNTLITANSEVRISGVYGVLKLSLAEGSYAWQFIPVGGQAASDAGSGTCH